MPLGRRQRQLDPRREHRSGSPDRTVVSATTAVERRSRPAHLRSRAVVASAAVNATSTNVAVAPDSTWRIAAVVSVAVGSWAGAVDVSCVSHGMQRATTSRAGSSGTAGCTPTA
ncbi:MAG: hypothetical protein IPK26_27655 [Planctomycetes bacterium]|nr:hypothetical protein [Planctomycetota bacterium]